MGIYGAFREKRLRFVTHRKGAQERRTRKVLLRERCTRKMLRRCAYEKCRQSVKRGVR